MYMLRCRRLLACLMPVMRLRSAPMPRVCCGVHEVQQCRRCGAASKGRRASGSEVAWPAKVHLPDVRARYDGTA